MIQDRTHLAASVNEALVSGPDGHVGAKRQSGSLIINADDWGLDVSTTDAIFQCIRRGTVSSTSAMVFMEDSDRAAHLARDYRVDAGLHVNFTTPFSALSCTSKLLERQHKLAVYLRRSSLARVIYNPLLSSDFEYVLAAQIEEFQRLYQRAPSRLDGHHHMHLNVNVMFRGMLPAGTIVRRHFSEEPGEKPLRNRLFRKLTDTLLTRRHRLADRLFSLAPLEPLNRLRRIFSLACEFVVEVETHPVNPAEYEFLTGAEIFRLAGDCPIAQHYAVIDHATPHGQHSASQ